MRNQNLSRRNTQLASLELDVAKYVVDLPIDLARLHAAIDASDDEIVWGLYRQCRSPEIFMDWVGNIASSLVTRIRHPKDNSRAINEHHSLLVIPVLLSATAWMPALDDRSTQELTKEAARLTRNWLSPDTSAVMFGRLFDYGELCAWSPAGVRERLAELAKVSTPRSVLAEESLRLPANAPRLQFLVASAQRLFGYPEIDHELTGAACFDQRMSACLNLWLGSPNAVAHVGFPEMFTDGVRTGLCEWVRVLIQDFYPEGWSIDPINVDTTLFNLHCGDEVMQIPVRLHQVGFQGLDLVVSEAISAGLVPEKSSASAQ